MYEAVVLTPFRTACDRRLGQAVAAVRTTSLIAAACTLAAASAVAQVPANSANLLIPTSLQPGQAVPGVPSAAVSEIEARIESAAGGEIAGERLHGALLRRFYAAHNYAPVWTTRQPQAAALLNAVLRAGDHGLDPDLFHAALLRNATTLSPLDRELMLSDAFLGLADALARGVLPIEERMDDEDLTPEPIDVAGVLDSAINSPDPAAVIEALAPHTPSYSALQGALQTYRRAATGPETASSAATGARVAPSAAVDKSNEARLRQIEVNLERLRWLPRTLPADRVWVNVANAQLVLYRSDMPIFTTRVVVGQPDKQTPEFRTTIDSLLFNPPWNVPRSIAEMEILPKLGRDPSYLSRHHMTVRSNGAIQQLAGPYSALGRLKFEMTDRFDVYLHDTPEKALFVRDNRRQSHGCVRVQNPRELAALLLQQPVDVIEKGIALGYTNRRMLPTPLPVFLVYQTAFAGPNGIIQFRPDVYDRDAEIWPHLHPLRQAPVAQHETAVQPHG
jgi:murein L,D-transpeptidase YcbB/YkuD